MKKLIALLLLLVSLSGFGQSITPRQGDALGILIAFSDTITAGRAKDISLFIGKDEMARKSWGTVKTTNDKKAFRVDLSSKDTRPKEGKMLLQIAIYDSLLGVRRTSQIPITFLSSNNTFNNTAISTTVDVTINVTVSNLGVTSNVLLATVMKGDKGDPGDAGSGGGTSIDTTLYVRKVSGYQLSQNSYTTTEKSKLAGVASGATANSTDAQLRDRSTHTGTQSQSTVTNLVANLGAKADTATVSAKAPLVSPSFTGPLKVGPGVSSSGGRIFIAETYSGPSTTNAHGFEDNTIFDRGGGAAYNSFDARAQITGGSGGGVNHYYGFQEDGTVSMTGLLDHYTSYASAPNSINASITRRAGFRAFDINRTGGFVWLNWGLKVDELINGVNNYAIYTEGLTQSQFGQVNLGMTSTTSKLTQLTNARSFLFAGGTDADSSGTITMYGKHFGGTNANGKIQYKTVNSQSHEFSGGNLYTAAGNAIGIGNSSLTGYSARVSKGLTGATSVYGVAQDGIVQTDVTANAYSFLSQSKTAAGFTLGNYTHFFATQSTLSSTPTIQQGFVVNGNMTGAGTNLGFVGNIPASAGRWNNYHPGTAQNYFRGNVNIGVTETNDGVNALQVDGSVKATQYRLSSLNTAPSSATDTGTTGEVRVTAGFIYVCTAANTWVRAALSTW